jgi:hypothetical protein
MRETPRAMVAYADYEALGSGRSLAKLAAEYQRRHNGGATVPTVHLRRLEEWSSRLGWPQRIAAELGRQREEAEAAVREERAEILSSGLALTHERVKLLEGMARREASICVKLLDAMERDDGPNRRRLSDEYGVMKIRLDASLKALAEETGGRVRRVNVVKALEDYAVAVAKEEGVPIEEAKRIARMVTQGIDGAGC